MMDHPSSINRFDAFGDYDYVDTSHHVTHNTPNFESLKGVNNLIKVDLIGCLNTRKCKATFHYIALDSNTICLISVAPQNGEVTHHSCPPPLPASTVIQRPYRHHDQVEPHQPPRHPQHGTVSNRLTPPDQVRARIVDHKDSSKVARTPPLEP